MNELTRNLTTRLYPQAALIVYSTRNDQQNKNYSHLYTLMYQLVYYLVLGETLPIFKEKIIQC